MKWAWLSRVGMASQKRAWSFLSPPLSPLIFAQFLPNFASFCPNSTRIFKRKVGVASCGRVLLTPKSGRGHPLTLQSLPHFFSSHFPQFPPISTGIFSEGGWGCFGWAWPPVGVSQVWPRPSPAGGHLREGAAADPHPPGGSLVAGGRGRGAPNHHLLRLPAHPQPPLPQGGRGHASQGAWSHKIGRGHDIPIRNGRGLVKIVLIAEWKGLKVEEPRPKLGVLPRGGRGHANEGAWSHHSNQNWAGFGFKNSFNCGVERVRDGGGVASPKVGVARVYN